MSGEDVKGIVVAVVISIVAVLVLALVALAYCRLTDDDASSVLWWGGDFRGKLAVFMGVLGAMAVATAVLTYVIAPYFVKK